MNIKSTVFLVYLALCAAGVYQMIHFYPLLPDTIASHFGFDGQADDWSPKSHMVVMHGGLLVMLSGLFLGIGAVLQHTPSSWLNLPNKEYWLAAERKEETLRVYADHMLWIGNATLLFFLYTMQRVYLASLMPVQELGGAYWLVFAAYLALIAALCVGLSLRFRRPIQVVGTELGGLGNSG